MNSFYEWLKEQSKAKSPIGDLAQNTMSIDGASKTRNNLKSWQDFMSLNWDSSVLDVLEEAWNEYSKSI